MYADHINLKKLTKQCMHPGWHFCYIEAILSLASASSALINGAKQGDLQVNGHRCWLSQCGGKPRWSRCKSSFRFSCTRFQIVFNGPLGFQSLEVCLSLKASWLFTGCIARILTMSVAYEYHLNHCHMEWRGSKSIKSHPEHPSAARY